MNFLQGTPDDQPPAADAFSETRLPDDICLVTEVRNLLVGAGLLPKVVDAYDSSVYIQDAKNFRPEGQRFVLNRYWNLQLLQIEANTVDERFCLVTTGEFIDWVRLFRTKILPCVISNDLPKRINRG